MNPLELLAEIGIELIWFDSLGAKSACILVRSSIGNIVIDPGAAEMQPSYPLPSSRKRELRREALSRIVNVCQQAKIVVITHYHYDHHVLPSDPDLGGAGRMYLGKTLLVKNPNCYINASQWKRARLFIGELLKLVGRRLEDYLIRPQDVDFPDLCDKLTTALSKDFGDYNPRRKRLLQEGKKWFNKLAQDLWSRELWISEIDLPELKIMWCDCKKFALGDTELNFLEPWFHGVEYDRTGWVVPILIRKGNWKIFYTSDVMGPIIEDYAEHIYRVRPDIVIVDGPPTYLFPYMLNRVNLQRAIENMLTILSGKPKLVIYDHHLLREKKWRERIKTVFNEARRLDVQVLTAAEVLGQKPLIDHL